MSQKEACISFRSGPYVHKGRYYNYPGETGKGFIYHSAQMYITSLIKRLCNPAHDHASWSEKFIFKKNTKPVITWIGHASFLIQFGNITIITDPIFGHASWLFRRIMGPGIALSDLPKIDYVLLSHNHRDHMDQQTLYALQQQSDPVFLVPDGNKKWFDCRNFKKVFEFSWWQTHQTALDLSFTFLPAYHWSQRGLFDRNTTLWGSWLIKDSTASIYFAGDTGYQSHFKEIGKEYQIDYALLPIGPCEPHEWMKHSHLSAKQAGQAFLDLNAHSFVPMHWGTFYFGTDMFLDPIINLRAWWRRHYKDLITKQLHEMKMGQSIQIPYRDYQKRTQQGRPIQ